MISKYKIIFLIFFLIILLSVYKFYDLKNNISFDRISIGDHELELIFSNNKLIIKDNNENIVISENFEYSLKNIDLPKLQIFKNSVLIYFTYKTNKLESLLELWVYDYDKKEIEKIFDLDQDMYLNYSLKDDFLTIIDLDFSSKIIFSDEIDLNFIKSSGELNISAHMSFFISDSDELVTKRVISTGAVEWIENKILLTYYTFEDNKFSVIRYELK